jgi:hypothetical protein
MLISLNVYFVGRSVSYQSCQSMNLGMYSNSRNRPRAAPFVDRFLPVGEDLLAVSQQCKTCRIFSDPVKGPVEMSSLAVRGEHVLV